MMMVASSEAPFWPDDAAYWRVPIVDQRLLARDTYRIRLRAPDLAERITPGQFVMLRIPGLNDPLLGRPFALYDTIDGDDGRPRDVDIVYLVKGKMTRLLADAAPGAELEVWGPLGNGFISPGPLRHAVFVAGGIGQTPFVALARELTGRRRYGKPPREVPAAERVTLCYGARSRDFLAGLDDFQAAGCRLRIATEDGSQGAKGLVTDVLAELLEADDVDWIATCGPEPMMEAVADLAAARDIPCHVSLETPMACGIGACFSCVVPVRQEDGQWDYKRTCIEGPVFDAKRIVWEI